MSEACNCRTVKKDPAGSFQYYSLNMELSPNLQVQSIIRVYNIWQCLSKKNGGTYVGNAYTHVP